MGQHYSSAEDIERDKAKVTPTCFWDDLPGTVLVNGIYLCESHAVCSTCLKFLEQVKAPVGCSCADYGYCGHEELLWCSLECMESAHPDRDDLFSERGEELEEEPK